MSDNFITRTRDGKYIYHKTGIRVSSEDMIRINRLRIPPSWTNVRIETDPTSYLQVTGVDKSGLTQYLYHPLWNQMTRHAKYDRIRRFCLLLPRFMKKVEGWSRECGVTGKIGIMFLILYKTHIRVGNECYLNDYNTYGLTTLKKRHVILGVSPEVRFVFVGKKSVRQNLCLRDVVVYSYLKRELAGIKSGDTVFEGISARTLNDYMQNHFGKEFTCKDFRTWGANRRFLDICLSSGSAPTKKELGVIIEKVADYMGHTKAVCRSSYLADSIIDRYLSGKLDPVLQNNMLRL